MSTSEVEVEQQYSDLLYGRLDVLRARTEAELGQVRRSGATGTPQMRSERDAFATLYAVRLHQLNGVEERLCFGRLDMTDGSPRYIGRVGLFDDDQSQLLVDWRAPASRDFYQATPLHPGDVVRRRHLQTRNRVVDAIYDDVLDLDAFERRQDLVAHTSEASSLATDGALLVSLNARRTGRMSDIVATIQAEQDEIVRSPLQGVVVVQGGPGTGKTAVALHRAAYLLYTHRKRLEARGVLLVGPSTVFLRYISQVLPSLGETGVVTVTPDELYPGVDVRGEDDSAAARLKGSLGMADVLARAVRQRVRTPRNPLKLRIGSTTLDIRPRTIRSAIDAARRGGRPHNMARVSFVRTMMQSLVDHYANATGQSPETVDRDHAESVLRDSLDVRRELNLIWPPLTVEQVLGDLYASPDRLYDATPGWTNDDRVLLLRARGESWNASDVPLLDEVAELLGGEEESDGEAAEQATNEEVRHARAALQQMGGLASQLVSAETLAERFALAEGSFTVAERAYADRSWRYGHVIVDEAQELSPMMWRLLLRRCPSGSLTVVGDTAQATGAAASASWSDALGPHVGDKWTRYDLSINYRTPAAVMEAACAMLAAAGHPIQPPTSVRDGDPPKAVRIDDAEDLLDLVTNELKNLDGGRLAVITSNAQLDETVQSLTALAPADETQLETPLVVLSSDRAKGLEFDVVIAVDPVGIMAEGVHGDRALFVTMTRATQRLVLAHSGELPEGLAELSSDSLHGRVDA